MWIYPYIYTGNAYTPVMPIHLVDCMKWNPWVFLEMGKLLSRVKPFATLYS